MLASRIPQARASLVAGAAGLCALSLGGIARPIRASDASEAQQIQLVVFRHPTQDALAPDPQDASRYRFKYLQSLRPSAPPLRRVSKVQPIRDMPKEFAGSRPAPVARALGRRLERMVRTAGGSRRRKEGQIDFILGQIYWDGKNQAVVQAYTQYHFDDRSQGDYGAGAASGWSYHLQKVRGHWRFLSRRSNFAAG